MTAGLIMLSVFTIGFALIAKRLSNTILTAPMVFIALGVVLSITGLLPQDEAESGLHLVAEIALIVLLFLDAAQIEVTALRNRYIWPARMLTIGLPLAILFGVLAAYPFLPGWPLAAIALVASVLTPTDAALGAAVIQNPVIPPRVRRAITVESGLNDGLALPAVLLFASLTAEAVRGDQTVWLVFAAKQLLFGPAVGAAIGLLGGWLLLRAKERDLTTEVYEGIGAIALAMTAYLAARLIGGNGFISAFAAGLCFGAVLKGQCRFVYEFTESEGQILSWSAFFLLGLALVPTAVQHLDFQMLALILISLFIVRPLAIYVSLMGTDASPLTRIFFGWFGPRGLATALFALLIVKQIDQEFAEPILMLAVNAVWISALLHGISAVPAARWYARKVKETDDSAALETIEQSIKNRVLNKR